MVYLGPIQPRPVSVKAPSRPANTTAVTAYAHDQQGARIDEAAAGLPPSGVERRKQDRRGKTGEHLVETRTGRDRRKSPQASINISV